MLKVLQAIRGMPRGAVTSTVLSGLKNQIMRHDLKLIVVDPAKSVSSSAGWKNISNESTKAILTYMRECICEPLGCTIVFLSHDGTA